MGEIINVIQIATIQKEKIKIQVENLKKLGIKPCIKVILVGNNAASLSYVLGKEKTACELGIDLEVLRFEEDLQENELLNLIQEINEDKSIHGLITQLPLPKHIDENKITQAINPLKDIDGFHPINQGNNLIGNKALIPCTPKGIMKILENFELSGKHVVIIGRSNIVGKPIALLCLQKNATITITHSKTKNLQEICKNADVLIVAIGIPNFIDENYVKKSSIIIDVGINKINNKLYGDVNLKKVIDICSYITPVPKGVGVMTIAMLLQNTIEAICLQQNIEIGDLC